MIRTLLLCLATGLLLALALPQAIPWISLQPIDPAGHLELLAWIALVPSLLALDRARTGGRAFGVGLLAGVAYFYAAIWWVNHAMTAFGGVPFALALVGLSLLVLYMAAHWAAAYAVAFTVRRWLGWPLWTHFPLVFAAFELVRNYLFTGFPWGNLGYTQARHHLVAQLAAVGGVYLIAALVALVNCAVHAVVRARLARERVPWRPPAVAGVALALSLAYGAVHLASVRARAAAAPRLAVALVQGNVNQSVKNEARTRGTHADDILRRYVPLTEQADREGADLVAWPEAAYPYAVPARPQTFADPRTGIPRLSRAHLLLGAATYEEHRENGRRVTEGSNSVFLLSPGGMVLGRYAKHHLVPFGEYVPTWLAGILRSVVPQMALQRPGSELRVLEFTPTSGVSNPSASPRPRELSSGASAPSEPPHPRAPPPRRDESRRGVRQAEPVEASNTNTSTVRLAPMICFDAIFPEVNVAFAAQDPDLLVNPTNDAWYGYSSGPYQFLSMVALRAVEAGKAVARPAYAGVSALIEPTGEVQPGALPVGPVDPDLAPDPDEPPRLLVGSLPRLRGRTLYTTVGDLFAGAATASTGIALALALRARRRERRARQGATG